MAVRMWASAFPSSALTPGESTVLTRAVRTTGTIGATRDVAAAAIRLGDLAVGDERLEEVDSFMEAWRADGEFMQQQPGSISTQLHRGIARSTTFINVAEWESIEAFRAAASKPEFQASLSGYPDSAVASPHLFTRVAVPGICGD